MTGLDGLREKGYYLRIVKIGDLYALKVHKPNSFEVYADLTYPERWTWERGGKFFHDCLTNSELKIKEVFEEHRHGFKVRCDDPKGLALDYPDAQLVKTSEGLYGVRIREKIWWNPLSRAKFVDFKTQDFSGVIRENNTKFKELCLTRDKKLAYEVYKACLRKRPVGDGELEVVDTTCVATVSDLREGYE